MLKALRERDTMHMGTERHKESNTTYKRLRGCHTSSRLVESTCEQARFPFRNRHVRCCRQQTWKHCVKPCSNHAVRTQQAHEEQTLCSVKHSAQSDTLLSQTLCPVRHSAQPDTGFSQTLCSTRHSAQSDTVLSQTLCSVRHSAQPDSKNTASSRGALPRATQSFAKAAAPCLSDAARATCKIV
jgi:hypothetical protein